ncbi:hypothetical protein, partial [Thiorhodovibrio frisius]|uniref:DUF3782 domain-containing protein n=1 Tax=Thiorhodovibrio frisius TaxID=631362 RepID=H8YXI3_9GAMM
MSQANPTLDDVWRLFQETDRRFQETDRLMKESAKETDRRFQETDLLVKRLSKNLGDLGNRLGEFVEHLVAPAVVRLFRGQGIEVHAVYPGVSAKRNGEALEIDLLVVNEGALIAVECKSKLTCEHIDEQLARTRHRRRIRRH